MALPYWIEGTDSVWMKDSFAPYSKKYYKVYKNSGFSPDGNGVFDFFTDCSSVNSTNFDVGSGVSSDGSVLEITGPSFSSRSWGNYYYVSKEKFSRPFIFEAQSKGVGSRGDFMIGAFDNDGGYSYTEMVYAHYQSRNDGSRLVYEDGSNRISSSNATTNADVWYNDKIIVYDTGADYYVDDISIYNSSYSSENNLRVGITAASSTQQFDNLRVRKYIENEPTIIVTEQPDHYLIEVTNDTSTYYNNVQFTIPALDLNVSSETESLEIVPHKTIQWTAFYPSLFDGCVSYWDFRGDATDVIGDNNGSVNGASLTTGHLNELSSAYYFDGSNDNINLGDLGITSGDFTIIVWFKNYQSLSADNWGAVFGTPEGGDPDQWFGIVPVNKEISYNIGIHFHTNNCDSGVQATIGEWFHVSAVNDSTNNEQRIYINGELKGTSNRTLSLPSSGTYYMGYRPLSSAYSNIDVSCGLAYNGILSANQIKSHYDLTKQKYIYPLKRGERYA